MKSGQAFSGFPQDTMQFLRELRDNNNRPWFEANKTRYQDHVVAPAQAFVLAMGSRLQTPFPDIVADPRTNGSGSLFRIYRDVRFSHDKSPYKTNIGIFFWQSGLPKSEAPGFYFHLDGDRVGFYAGVYGFGKSMLDRYRQAVVHPQLGPALLSVVAAVQASGPYEISGKHYKKNPRGYEAPDDRADFLLYNTLYAHTEWPSGDFLHTAEILNISMEHFTNMHPLLAWLSEWMAPNR